MTHSFSDLLTAIDNLELKAIIQHSPMLRTLYAGQIIHCQIMDTPYLIDNDNSILLNESLLKNTCLCEFYLRCALEIVTLIELAHESEPGLAYAACAVLGTSYYQHLVAQSSVETTEALYAQGPHPFGLLFESIDPTPTIATVHRLYELSQMFIKLPDVLIKPRVLTHIMADRLRVALEVALPLEALLTSGGDERIDLDKRKGTNRYHCLPIPGHPMSSFSSCTASRISYESAQKSERARQRLIKAALAGRLVEAFSAESNATRHHIASSLCEGDITDNHVILTPSGTDAEYFPLALCLKTKNKPLTNILIAPNEIGSGSIYSAVGQHFSSRTPMGKIVKKGDTLDGFGKYSIKLQRLSLRNAEGILLDDTHTEAELSRLIEQEISLGHQILLHLLDASKTGAGAPRLSCARALKAHYGDHLEVLVDAAQLRTSQASIQTYLHAGFMVLISGSKFIAGPAFSGALLLPARLIDRAKTIVSLPKGLKDYLSQYEVSASLVNPKWGLSDVMNPGLLLRWTAALHEMQRFYALPESFTRHTLNLLYQDIFTLIQSKSHFEWLPTPCIERASLSHWDSIPTIFSFFMLDQSGHRASYSELKTLYHRLMSSMDGSVSSIGQPVQIDVHGREPTGVLRVAISAPHVTTLYNTHTRDIDDRQYKRLLQQLNSTLNYLESLYLMG